MSNKEIGPCRKRVGEKDTNRDLSLVNTVFTKERTEFETQSKDINRQEDKTRVLWT